MKTNKRYTKKQILESIKHWERVLKQMDESFKVSLADKQSVTKALYDHNDELTDFVNQKPHPTKDELIQFVADIFKEECLDTPWTRQFLIKLKIYTHSWDDAVQYLWNARMKGDNLGMDQGLHHHRSMHEDDEFKPNKYFVQLFKCTLDGKIIDDGIEDAELKEYYPAVGLDKFFNRKNDAFKAVKSASSEVLYDINTDAEFNGEIIPGGDIFTGEDYHVLGVVRQGDDYESDVVACFIDGKLSPLSTISNQLKLNEDEFFSKTRCDRCGGSLSGGRTMSMFNTDTICMKCAGQERKRPDYEAARDAEAKAVKSGDMNFKGIGLRESDKKALCTLGDLVKRIKNAHADNCAIQWVEERPDGSAEIVFSRGAGAFDAINLSKDRVDETVTDMTNRTGDQMHQIENDNSIHITVEQLDEMADVLYPGQDRSPVNVGTSGKNFGQVNSVTVEGDEVVLTLAPYKNGRQSRDLSIEGLKGPALNVTELMRLVRNAPKSYDVTIKMKDPYGFGPRANLGINVPVIAIDVDRAYGIFFRVDEDYL